MDKSASPPKGNPRSTEFDVAVVGTGIVGLTCALAAAHANLSVAIIGAKPNKDEPSAADGPFERRVFALSPASHRFLQSLKVWDELDVSTIGEVTDMQIFATGTARPSLHLGAYQAGVTDLARIVGHDALVRALAKAVSFQPTIQWREDQCTTLDFSEAQVVVGLGQATLSARLVVGADGIHSHVRTASGLVAQCTSLSAKGVVANFESEPGHGGRAFQWFTDQGIVALLPLPGRAVSLVWSAPDALADELTALSGEQLAARLSPWAAPQLGALRSIGAVASFPLNRLKARAWVKERVALIGDAAHVVHPLAGQGLNLGLDDARVLVEVLAARPPVKDCGDLSLLRRFERRRKEAVAIMGEATDGLRWIFAGPLAPMAGAAMTVLNRSGFAKRRMIAHALENAAPRFLKELS